MRILVATVDSETENVQRARRRVGYDRLVLVADARDEAAARTIEESEGRLITVDAHAPAVELVDGDDFDAATAALADLWERLKGHTLRLALCGGPHSLQFAGLVFAFNRGLAIHVSNGESIRRLPVFAGFSITERLTADDRHALAALSNPSTTHDLRARLGWDTRRFGKAVGRLRNAGLLRPAPAGGSTGIARTAVGEYYAGGRRV
jgi:hypothetical protein